MNTLVSSVPRLTLRCHRRRAKLSLWTMNPFPRYIWVVRWNPIGEIRQIMSEALDKALGKSFNELKEKLGQDVRNY